MMLCLGINNNLWQIWWLWTSKSIFSTTFFKSIQKYFPSKYYHWDEKVTFIVRHKTKWNPSEGLLENIHRSHDTILYIMLLQKAWKNNDINQASHHWQSQMQEKKKKKISCHEYLSIPCTNEEMNVIMCKGVADPKATLLSHPLIVKLHYSKSYVVMLLPP